MNVCSIQVNAFQIGSLLVEIKNTVKKSTIATSNLSHLPFETRSHFAIQKKYISLAKGITNIFSHIVRHNVTVINLRLCERFVCATSQTSHFTLQLFLYYHKLHESNIGNFL